MFVHLRAQHNQVNGATHQFYRVHTHYDIITKMIITKKNEIIENEGERIREIERGERVDEDQAAVRGNVKIKKTMQCH